MISGDQLLRPFRIYRGILPMLKKNPNASMVVSLANKPYSITQPASLKIIKSQNWQLILKQPQGPTAWPNPGREFPVVFFSGPVSVSKESQAVTSRDIPKGPHLLTPVNSKKPRSKKKHVGIQWLRSVLAPKILQVKFLVKENRLRMASNKTKIPGKMRRIASAEAGTSEENLFECA